MAKVVSAAGDGVKEAVNETLEDATGIDVSKIPTSKKQAKKQAKDAAKKFAKSKEDEAKEALNEQVDALNEQVKDVAGVDVQAITAEVPTSVKDAKAKAEKKGKEAMNEVAAEAEAQLREATGFDEALPENPGFSLDKPDDTPADGSAAAKAGVVKDLTKMAKKGAKGVAEDIMEEHGEAIKAVADEAKAWAMEECADYAGSISEFLCLILSAVSFFETSVVPFLALFAEFIAVVADTYATFSMAAGAVGMPSIQSLQGLVEDAGAEAEGKDAEAPEEPAEETSPEKKQEQLKLRQKQASKRIELLSAFVGFMILLLIQFGRFLAGDPGPRQEGCDPDTVTCADGSCSYQGQNCRRWLESEGHWLESEDIISLCDPDQVECADGSCLYPGQSCLRFFDDDDSSPGRFLAGDDDDDDGDKSVPGQGGGNDLTPEEQNAKFGGAANIIYSIPMDASAMYVRYTGRLDFFNNVSLISVTLFACFAMLYWTVYVQAALVGMGVAFFGSILIGRIQFTVAMILQGKTQIFYKSFDVPVGCLCICFPGTIALIMLAYADDGD